LSRASIGSPPQVRAHLRKLKKYNAT